METFKYTVMKRNFVFSITLIKVSQVLSLGLNKIKSISILTMTVIVYYTGPFPNAATGMDDGNRY